jgi:hypothetical protein
LYEYQQFFQHRICFSIQPQLQLVNLHRNRRYFVIKLHKWFCLSYFLKTNIKFVLHLSILYEYQQFFQHHIYFSIQPPDYSDPWPRLEGPSSCSLIMLMWLYNFFVKMLVINYISTRSLKKSAKFTSPIYDDKYHIIISNCD